jgi:predicted TIM-barrel fold metal-dependent hydrolase
MSATFTVHYSRHFGYFGYPSLKVLWLHPSDYPWWENQQLNSTNTFNLKYAFNLKNLKNTFNLKYFLI